MFAKVVEARELTESVLAELEPEVLEGALAQRLVAEFAALERLCAAGKALCARQVAHSGAWRKQGDRSPAHWMARRSGTSVGQATAALKTAERMKDLPATEEAYRAGKLSETQAREIASAAAASPASEADLLRAAETEVPARLRQRCRQLEATAMSDEAARHEAIHRSRYLRHWSDDDGGFRLDGRLTPEAGAVVLAALRPHHERIFREARRGGRRESHQACAADALVALARGDERSGPKATVEVRVDHAAWARGHTEPGETCEIEGVGPVPVATARSLANDAVVSAVVSDGVDVTTVAHLGRSIPAHLRTALLARDPTCVVPGCGVREHLEIDHVVPLAEGGPTRLDNLARLCQWHHQLKTYRGYRLSGGPGQWLWQGPDHEVPHSGDPPNPDSSELIATTLPGV